VGTLALAFFAKPEHVLAMAGSECSGIFYSSSGWTLLGIQLLGARPGRPRRPLLPRRAAPPP
jgi:hypothetical protein